MSQDKSKRQLEGEADAPKDPPIQNEERGNKCPPAQELHKSEAKSIEERVSWLEGHRVGWQKFVTVAVSVIAILAGLGVFNAYTVMIDQEVERQVAGEISDFSTAVAEAVATAVAARNEIILVATQFDSLLIAQSTPPSTVEDAEDAIISYYRLLDDKMYAGAWSMLTSSYQNRTAEGSFDTYVDLWDGTERVVLLEHPNESFQGTLAVFFVRLEITWQPSTIEKSALRITLIYDPSFLGWKILEVVSAE